MAKGFLIPFQKLRVADPLLSQMFDNLGLLLADLGSREILLGQVLSAVAIRTSETLVPHTLGRPVVGWIVIKKNGVGDVWDTETTNNKKERFLALRSSVLVTVSLWVF